MQIIPKLEPQKFHKHSFTTFVNRQTNQMTNKVKTFTPWLSNKTQKLTFNFVEPTISIINNTSLVVYVPLQ